jgi:predicted polyphosphate/ATP-dependent NAD kinase
VLFVNPRSGDGAASRHGVVERAHRLGLEVQVLGHSDDLRELALRAVAGGADALGMASGDGSLATVAEVAASHPLPFLCVPVGTRNHFVWTWVSSVPRAGAIRAQPPTRNHPRTSTQRLDAAVGRRQSGTCKVNQPYERPLEAS